MVKFAYMFATIINRFTLILATAGLLVALFAIAGGQGNTVSARTIVIPESDSTLSPAIASASVDNDEPLTAQLNTSELTLQEGQVETIQIDLDGDLSSLVDGDTTVLTIEARPVEGEETGLIRGTSDIYLPAEQTDYELTPVTIDKQAGQATFEIRAVDDIDYDPLESVMLELVSHSDDVEVVSPDSLKLKIENNDPRPFVSFSSTIGTQRLYGGYATTDIPGSSVPEGEQRDFRVVLDRESNRDVEFFIAFSGRPHLFSNDNEELVLPSDYIWIHGYLIEQGYRPGNPLKDWSLLRIPAGELGTTFTVDTRSAENDLYDYYWDRTISFGWLYVDKDDYAYTDRIGARHNFFMAQDEPVPQLLLKSSAADDDGDATVTVREGESFDIWVDISHQLGASVLFNEPGINLRAQLTATTVSGTVLNLDLPDVLIGPYQSGVTVRIPAGSLANDEGTVILALEDVVTMGRDTSIAFVNELSVRVPNRLVVTILDDESPVVVPPSQPPVVRVRAVSETVLVEGSSVLLAVELTNAPEGGAAQDITVHLDTGSGTTLTRRDYRDTSYPSSVTISQGQNRVEFNIKVRRNALTQDSDVINLYVSSVDYGGENYEQSDSGVDLTITDYIAMPIVTILDHRNPLYADRIHTVNEGPYSARLYVKAQIPSTYVYESFYSVPRDVVVHLAARNITTSDSDYSFPSSVTVRRGRTGVDVLVKALDDDLVEFGETFEIYVASVEYRGKTFELSDAGVRLTIDNYDDVIQTSIKVPGGVDQLEGTTVTVQVELSEELPANIPANSVKLAFTPRDDARTVGQLPYVVDITEDLRGSTVVDVPFFLAADYLQEQADLVDLSVVISDDELRQLMSGSQSYFRIVADDGQNYEQPDTGADLTIIDNENPPIVTIRQVWPGLLYEDEFGWRTTPRWSDSELWRRATVFEAVLTNAPSGGTAETITVHLETGDSTTASESDYSYPDIVTIPPGESVVRFTIRARSDWQREYRETLNVYVSSVDYLGQNYEQSDSGVDLNIIGDDKIRPYVTVLGGDVHLEGSTVTVQIELSEVLPARIPAGSVKLAISLTGATRSVAVDGQSHIFEGSEPFVIDITEDLKNSTLVELSFHLIDNHSLEQTSLMKIEWIVAREESIPFSPVRGNRFNPILLENTWPFSFSIVDDDGRDSDNDGLDIDNDLAPTITFLPRYPRSVQHRTVYEGRRSGYPYWVPEKSFWVELTDTSPGGAAHDITVHLATQSGATASESDYSYPSSVTIPRGQRRVLVSVRSVDDDELEQDEYFVIYASSIDYRGRSYEQSYANIKWWIHSDEEIHGSITPLSGVDQVKGRTVTVRIEISEVPPPDIRSGSARLSFLLSGSTRAVDATVDGKPYILGTNELWWTSLSLPWEHFRNSTTLDIPFYLADDGLPEEPELTLLMRYNASFWGFDSTGIHPETNGLFRVIDNDDLPLVSVRSGTSTSLTSTSSVRRSDLNSVDEGDTVQLEIELTNAPEGGATQDITVHLATQSGATASESDYSYPSSVTIPQGQSRVTFEISALQDDLVEDDETLNIYASSVDYNGYNYGQSDAGVDLTIVDAPLVVVPPVTATTISATLTRSALTLQEGQVATVTVDLSGDLSSLVDGDTTVLTIEASPVEGEETGLIHGTSDIYLPAEQTDYELTLVTIDKQSSQATFEIRAVEDSDYDPLESVMLELVSHSDDIEIGSPNGLKLKIGDNDPRPFVSFTTTLTTGRYFDGTSNIKVSEGDKGTFRVVLDRKSNRSVEVYIYSDGGFRPFFDANGVDPIQTLDHALWRYISDQGFWTYNETVLQSDPLIIPAGELGLTFIADTTSFANDLYDYIEEDYFGTVLIYMKQSAYAYTDDVSGKAHFRVLQDEPTPELSFRSVDDGDATITVREGESFDVKIDIDPELGRYHRVWNSLLPGISLASQLTATAVTGDVPDWELPDVEIVPGQSGFTVTVLVPVDGLSNGERTVVLDFEDALLSYTRSHLTVPPRIKNSLVVTILDAEPLTAQLNTSELTLLEGRAATVTVDLDGDLSSLIDGDTSVLTIEARPVEGVETGLIHGTSDIYLPAEQNDYELTLVTIDKQARQATFEIRAVEDSDYDPLESVMLELVSGSDDVQVVSPNGLKLKIGDNDPRPFVSFSSTIGTQRLNWEYENVGVQGSSVLEGDKRDYRIVLDRKSNRDTEFVVYLGGGDTPLLLREDGETPFPHSTYWSGPKYRDGEGYWSWSVREEWERVIIPAGELGLTFTVDTTSLENDLYDYYWDRALAVMFIYVYKEHYAYTDEIGSKHYFFLTQDEPAPKLLLKNSANDGDGDASITVSEGESFDIWVDISHQLGTLVIFDEPGLNLKARLTATTVSGAELNLDLPDVLIGAYQSGVTVTMRIPVGSFANGEGTVILALEDVAMTRRGTGIEFDNEISVRVPNRLIVTIVDDDEPPVVVEPPIVDIRSLSGVEVLEGDTLTLEVELTNAPEGGAAQDITVNLASGSSSVASRDDYSYPSSVTIPQGQSRVTFEVSVNEDNWMEGKETLNIYVNSVEYLGQHYEQSGLSIDLTIINTTIIGSFARERLPFAVYPFSQTVIAEGESALMVVELLDVQGEQDEVVTVFLENGLDASTTASQFDFSFPEVVTIPRGQTWVTFEVKAISDNLAEYDETLKIGVYQAYYRGYRYWTTTQSTSMRISYENDPIVKIQLKPSSWENSAIAPEGDYAPLEVVVINPPDEGLEDHIIVHLATRDITTSESDYEYLSSVTIQWIDTKRNASVWVFPDGLVEYDEMFNIYVTSVDYDGRNYEQSDAGTDVTIKDGNTWLGLDINLVTDTSTASLTSTSSVRRSDQGVVTEGESVLFEVELQKLALPSASENGADRDLTLHLVTGSVTTASYSDYSLPSSITIPDGENRVTFEVRAIQDYLVEDSETLTFGLWSAEYGGVSYQFRKRAWESLTIVDNEEPPIVTVRSGTSTSLTSTSSVRRSDLNEGDTVQLVAELTNAPEGGAPEDITVNLAAGNGATASESDYSYPSSVTIPQGQSRVTFEVSATQDDLVEDDEMLNIYASSVDFNSQNYEQSDTGADLTIVDVDFNDAPIVSVRRFGHNFSVNEGGVAGLIAELIPAPQYGTDRDITVHLAIGSWSTASADDYSYPSSVTIPRGQSFVRFDVQALDDNLPEYPETLNVHVSSVDYAGRSYVQSRGGVDLRIISDDRIEPVITVLGGVDHPEGSTVAVRIAVSQVLPANIPVNAITLSVLLSDSVRSVSVDGRPLVSGRPPVLYIVNALKASTSVDVVFSLTDDYIASPDGFVKLIIDSYDSLLLSGARSYFRIVDNDEPPVVVVPDPVVTIRSLSDTSTSPLAPLTSTSSVRRSDLSEGDTVQLVAELTNAPEGGAAEDITVFLAARAGGTAKPEDIDFPASVTIAAGDSSVRFPVSATEDSLVEYDEKINIYAASVEYGDSSLTLSDSGYDLTITSADRITARIAVLPSSDLVEGGAITIRIVLSSPLPARTPVESLYLALGSGYADIDVTEELKSSLVLDVDIQLQDDSLVGGNTSLTAELRFDAEEIPFLDGANVSFEVADNDEQPVVVIPVTPPPIVVEPDTESPTVVVPVTPPPIVVEPDTESPTVVIPVTPPPIVVEPDTESPTVVIPVTPPPIVVEPGTESPTVVIPVTPPPIVVEPGTESPTVVVPVTPPSIVVEPGTEPPTVVVPVTPPPIVVEPDTKPPVVVTPPPTVVPPDTGDKDRIEAAIEVLGTSNLTEGGVANLRIRLSKVLPKSIPADALQLVLNGSTHINDLSGLPIDLTKLLQDGASTEVAVRILDDNLLEADEKVSVRLDFKANQIPSLTGAEVSFTIADNDSGEIIVDASDDTLTEGQSSFLTLRLSNDLIAGSDIQIDYEFEFVDGGSHLAASSSDLIGDIRGSITLPTGSNSVRLELEPADDTIVEETEFLRFRLTRAAVDAGMDITIDNAHTDLLILDNDAASLPPLPRVIYVEADAAHGEVGERISVDGYFEFDQESAELFETSFNWLIVDGNGLFVNEPAELEIALVGEAVEVEGKSRMDVAVELILNAVIPAEGAADELRYLVLAIDQRASDGTRLDVVEYRAPLTVELARPQVVLISPDADNSHCEDDENACIQVPRGAAPEELQVEVVKLDGEEVAKELPQGYNYVPQVPVWDITFRDSEGQERDSLERGVQICLSADMAELDSVGGHEMVQIATFHEAHGDWLLLDTTYDAEQDRFCGYSRLFSDFALVYVMADTEVLPQLELPSTGGLSLPVWLVLLLALAGIALLAPALLKCNHGKHGTSRKVFPEPFPLTLQAPHRSANYRFFQ